MTRTRLAATLPGRWISVRDGLRRPVKPFTADRAERQLAWRPAEDRREAVSRLALIAAAVAITASGFGLGATMAIGPQGLVELAPGASFEASDPVLRSREEAPWPPDRVEIAVRKT
jgi:hypothetical protein